MIEKLFAENYGCLKKVETPTLGMLHAFIGPNDSGKSTLLRAVQLLTECASSPILASRARDGFDFSPGPERRRLKASVPGGVYEAVMSATGLHDGPVEGDEEDAPVERPWGSASRVSTSVRQHLKTARLLRLDPDALRKRSQLLPDGAPVTFTDDRGAGLPALYDHIINRGDGAFGEIRDRLVTLFPAVRALRLRTPTATEKEIEIELRDGTRVAAARMSEGLLYYLAFAALPYLSPTSIVLVEEPENGLHPARIGDVMRALRELSKTTQVLIATHSPLVVNELSGDEVTVVRRSADGNQLTLLKDTPNFAERSKVYALGELWLSYANGEDEAPLMTATPAR